MRKLLNQGFANRYLNCLPVAQISACHKNLIMPLDPTSSFQAFIDLSRLTSLNIFSKYKSTLPPPLKTLYYLVHISFRLWYPSLKKSPSEKRGKNHSLSQVGIISNCFCRIYHPLTEKIF